MSLAPAYRRVNGRQRCCELVGVALVVREITQDRAPSPDLAHNDPRHAPTLGQPSSLKGP